MDSKARISTEDKIAYEFFESLQSLYESINVTIKEVSDRIKDVNELKAYDEIQDIDENIPNIGITLNNKLVEIYQQFKEKGVQVFKSSNGKRIAISTLPSTSFIHLMNIVSEIANEQLEGFCTRHEELTKAKEKNWDKIGKSKNLAIKWIRAKMWETRIKFNESAISEIFYSEEEVEELRDYIGIYRDFDTYISGYDVQYDISESVLDFLESGNYSMKEVDTLLKNGIEADLEKMGMKDEIPYIRQEIKEKFEEDNLRPWQLSKEQKRAIQEETAINASKMKSENPKNIKQPDMQHDL